MSIEKDKQPSIIGLIIRTPTLSFNLAGSQSGKLGRNAKEKSLDVTLDDQTV